MGTICTKCGCENTEHLEFQGTLDLNELKSRVNFEPDTYTKQVVHRYVMSLLSGSAKLNIFVCQTCVSKGMKCFKKDV